MPVEIKEQLGSLVRRVLEKIKPPEDEWSLTLVCGATVSARASDHQTKVWSNDIEITRMHRVCPRHQVSERVIAFQKANPNQ